MYMYIKVGVVPMHLPTNFQHYYTIDTHSLIFTSCLEVKGFSRTRTV